MASRTSRNLTISTTGIGLVLFLVSLAPASTATAAEGPVRRSRPYNNPQQPTGFLNISAGIYEPTNQPGDGFYGTLAGGAEVTKQVDVGILISWYHRSSNSGEVTTTVVGPGGIEIEQTIQADAFDTDLVPFMGFFRYRFPTSPKFQPYVGGGIGYEWLSITREGVDPYGYGYTVGTDYGGFGGMALAGLNVVVTPTTSLYGEATYNWSTVTAEYFDPYYLISVQEAINMDGLGIQGGLKFRF